MRREGRIDSRHRVASDRDEARLVVVRVLDVAEDERRALSRGPADRAAELLLREGIATARQRIGSVEMAVAEESVPTAVPVVRARLRADVHDPAERAAELGHAAARHHLKLANDLLAVERPRQLRGIIIRGETVDEKRVADVALARH